MSADIGPGDLLVATGDWPAEYGCQALVAGLIYTCENIVTDNSNPCVICGAAGDGIVLVGDAPHSNACHCPCLLRPIRRPSESLFTDLLKSIPAELENA